MDHCSGNCPVVKSTQLDALSILMPASPALAELASINPESLMIVIVYLALLGIVVLEFQREVFAALLVVLIVLLIGYLAAAGASYLYNNVPDAEPKGQLRALIYLLALVGLGSLLFHTIGTKWAQWGDVIPIMLFLTLYLWVAFTNFFNMRVMWRIITIGAVVGAAVFAEVYTTEHTKDLTNWFPGIPGEVWSGALYAPIVIALITIGFILLREQPVAGGGVMAATAVFIVSLTLRFLDSQQPLCDALPVGTHFFWHICNAIVLYILTTIAIVHVRIARASQR